jgi:hypothetical protein
MHLALLTTRARRSRNRAGLKPAPTFFTSYALFAVKSFLHSSGLLGCGSAALRSAAMSVKRHALN